MGLLRTIFLHLCVVVVMSIAMDQFGSQEDRESRQFDRLAGRPVARPAERPVARPEGGRSFGRQDNVRPGPNEGNNNVPERPGNNRPGSDIQNRPGSGTQNRPEERPPRPTHAPVTTTTEATDGKLLKLPDPKKCASRPEHFSFNGHKYFYTDNLKDHHMKKYDWLTGRNICREYCMDLVSIETPAEDDMINEFIKKEDLPYIWTSGRLCNFKGCDRDDLKPHNVNGWFWSGSGVKMAPTNDTPPGWPYQPWSDTGHKTNLRGHKVPQPDNAEFEINESVEACMGILNDIYEDGIKWHDIACYHTKPLLCEDSEELLEYAESLNKKNQS